MVYEKHEHEFRLVKEWNHPRGKLFLCQRCQDEGLYGFRFEREKS